eukprot:3095339-Prymnesium_polylepis.1
MQGEHDGRMRGAQGHALLPFRAIARRPGSVRPGWRRPDLAVLSLRGPTCPIISDRFKRSGPSTH